MTNKINHPSFPCRRVGVVAAAGLVAAMCLWTHPLAAVEIEDDGLRDSAQQLVDATVTVRVVGARDFAAAHRQPRQQEADVAAPAGNVVTVCSGTCVAADRLLTFGCLPVVDNELSVKTEYRITLRAGEQATARPRVVDEHSGLVLLELEGHRPEDVRPLELAEHVPEPVAYVLAASASGVEEPLVSKGVLSGVDRSLVGTDLPPLLVCDISTTPSSSGAGLVDMDAHLVGIVAAASLPGENFGWTYAIPLKQIRRVLDAEQDGQIVVLQRVRPTLGVVLGPGEEVGAVVVQHVDDDGPGDQAGVAVGEQIVAIEGRVVRSVYQAGALLRKHLPGETITLTCRPPLVFDADGDADGGATEAPRPDVGPSASAGSSLLRFVEVTLGEQQDAAAQSLPLDVQQPAVRARLSTTDQIELSNTARNYQFRWGAPAAAGDNAAAGDPRGQGGLLRVQLQRYEELVEKLLEETERQRQHLEQRELMVEALLDELRRLSEMQAAQSGD